MVKSAPSSYRLQFNDGQGALGVKFTLDDGAAVVPYLHLLGVERAYASPLTQSQPGQDHGYGVIDYNKIDEGLGGFDALKRFSTALKENGLCLMLDIVPNHMRAGYLNPWWHDVLENGKESKFATFFEIDWAKQKGRVMVPVLGGQFDDVLANGELKLVRDGDTYEIRYWDHKFPVDPRTYGAILDAAKDGDVAAWWNAPENRDALRGLIEQQNYRLAHWRAGYGEINYRRFFDINELVGVMQENPEVFAEAHKLLLELFHHDLVQAVRIDHIDGLARPQTYVNTLRKLVTGVDADVVMEKIVEGDERPRIDGVDGTPGYEFMNQVDGTYIDSVGEKILKPFYTDFTGQEADFEKVLLRAKEDIVLHTFASEHQMLVDRLLDLAQSVGKRDFTEYDFRHGVRRLLKHFDVYRTYGDGNGLDENDQKVLGRALDHAKKKSHMPLNDGALNFIGDVLSGKLLADYKGDNLEEVRPAAGAIVRKIQQVSGPIMAKSKEDTAYYRHVLFAALNEVGGNPAVFGTSPEKFHAENKWRAEHAPRTMNATQTHDTKRGEDTRLRMIVLSELAQDWTSHVEHWAQLNDGYRGACGPDRNDEYLLYQMMIGAMPHGVKNADDPRLKDFAEDMKTYMRKAISEAKVHTSWIDHNADYENDLLGHTRQAANGTDEYVPGFIDKILAPENKTFLNSFIKFQARPSFVGAIYSLGRVALKTLSPGAPDFYQGTERWDLATVDPSNRRGVDFKDRAETLNDWQDNAPSLAALEKSWIDGHIKQFVTQRLLWLRQSNPALLAEDNYHPLETRVASDALTMQHYARKAVSTVANVVAKLVDKDGKRGHAVSDWLRSAAPATVPHGETENFTSFMWKKGDDTIVVAAPRLVAGETGSLQKGLSLSSTFNESSSVRVPGLKAGTVLTNIFTHETVTMDRDEVVSLAPFLNRLPLAVFTAGAIADNNPLPPAVA